MSHAKEVGSTVLNASGYVLMRVDPKDAENDRLWIRKHVHLWEKANGCIPEGFRLKCRTRDKQNCDPSNWIAVENAIIAYLSLRHFEDLPVSVQDDVIALARLEHKLLTRGHSLRSRQSAWRARQRSKARQATL